MRNSSHRQGREKKKAAQDEDKGRVGLRQDAAEFKFVPKNLLELKPRPCPFQHSREIVCPLCEGFLD